MKFPRILIAPLAALMLLAAANAQDQSQYPQSQYPPQAQPQDPPAQSPQQYPPQKPSAQNPSQSQYPQADYPPQPEPRAYNAPPYAPPAPAAAPLWLPQAIASLGQFAATRTEFSLDHSMLAFASKFDRDNQDLRRVIAGVSGVSVHSFHFPGGVSVDQMTMSSIAAEYREAGFQHLVSKHRGETGLTTDLWLRMDGPAIRDIAVLWEGNHDLNFVSVSGSISPLDLLHLSGHFGIPRMDGGVVVPAPRR